MIDNHFYQSSLLKILHFFVSIILLCLFISVSYAQQEKSVNEPGINVEITRDEIQSKIETLEAKPGIDPDSKARELKWYQLTDENLANKQWFEYLARNYQDLLKEEAGAERRQKENYLDSSKKLKAQLILDDISEQQLELQLTNLKSKLRELEEKSSQLSIALTKLNDRPQQIRTEMLVAKNSMDVAKAKTAVPLGATENKYEYAAQQLYLKTLLDALSAELKKLELEVTSIPAQIQLNKSEQEQVAVQKSQLKEFVVKHEQLAEKFKADKAQKLQQELSEIEQEISQKPTVIQGVMRENIQWQRDLQRIRNATNNYANIIDNIEVYRPEVEGNFNKAARQIKLAGLSPILGRVLREQRRNIANNKVKFQQGVNIQEETGLITLEQYRLENRQSQLKNKAEIVATLIQQQVLAQEQSPYNQKSIEQELNQLLIKQEIILDELSEAYTKGLKLLGDYEFSKQQLLFQINQYEIYLDERLLWVPSSKPVNFNFPLEIYNSFIWFISPGHWGQLVVQFKKAAESRLFMTVIAIIILCVLIYFKAYIKREKNAIIQQVARHYSDSIVCTFRVFLLNSILILPIPLALYFTGWLLGTLPMRENFSLAVGDGLCSVAISFFIIRFFYRFLETQGIADLHFNWPEKLVTFLRQQIIWMQVLIIPCIFFIYMVPLSMDVEHYDNLGRLALVIMMTVLTIFFVRLMSCKQLFVNDYFTAHTRFWWTKLRYFWWLMLISFPIVIIYFVLMGYYASALELQQKVILTLRFIFMAIILYSLTVRWLNLINRKMALKNLRQKRKAQELNERKSGDFNDDVPLNVEEEIFDIPKINEQTLKLLNLVISIGLLVSCWVIWQDILPAFSFLDNITLWQHAVVIDQQQVFEPITMTNLLLAAVYIFVMVTAVINFPGLMDVLFFRKLEIEAGTRYAVNQLTKYLLITIGFISVANILGGSWSQVQWLVAALTVGLGFGLQEIFANMVSGIILLFERPIRVGDTVTIENISGKVTRIQMRATSITDWDQKELVVPNKSFITNKLVNWTLTDPITRVVIPIGISYDADVEVAQKIIAETAFSSPLVRKDPEPCVLFMEFGESSLNFSIRVYVSELAHRLTVTNDIHQRLVVALRKAGIQIPYPQRDLHIRSGFPEIPGNIVRP